MSQKSTILIVDDEPIGRQLIDAILYKEGYNLEFAENGREAYEKARALNPDLILLDVMMPEVDGFEVCQMLRADEKMNNVPIILVTALDDIDSRIRGLEAGADDYISKPFDRLELLARIKIITRLNRYRKPDAASDKNGNAGGNVFSNELFTSLSDTYQKISSRPEDVFSAGYAHVIKGKGVGSTYYASFKQQNANYFYFSAATNNVKSSLLSIYFSSIITSAICSGKNTNEALEKVLNAKNSHFAEDEKSFPISAVLSQDGENHVTFTGINTALLLINGSEVSLHRGNQVAMNGGSIQLESKQISVQPGNKIILCSIKNGNLMEELKNAVAGYSSENLNDLKSGISEFLLSKHEVLKDHGDILTACICI